MTCFSLSKNVSRIHVAILIIFFSISTAMAVSCTVAEPWAGEEETSVALEKDMYMFDYKNIIIESTSAFDIKIKNYNIYLDLYDDLIILGEIENISEITKTDIQITYSFYDRSGEEIMSTTVPGGEDYLRGGSRLPFYYYYSDRDRYIDIEKIKVGANYKNSFERFNGNPIVKRENYYYEDDFLVVEGKVVNLGKGRIKDLELFCTFYNDKDQVVFIKEVFLIREEMMSSEEQKFTLKVFLDRYLPEFTDYRFEVFFEDKIIKPS